MASNFINIPMQVGLVEHDVNGDDLCVWMYPSLSQIIQTIAVKRSATEASQTPFIFSKYKNDWIYILRSSSLKDSQPEIESISIVVCSSIFNPEKYQALLDLFLQNYVIGNGEPGKILEAYLSVFTTGVYSSVSSSSTSKISFDMAKFPDINAVSTKLSCIKELIQKFGVEVVVIWNAIILKKRILFVGENVKQILSILRSLPLFAIHRNDWSVLRPLVTSDPEHIEDLTSSGVFIAGTIDESLATKTDIFDVVVSLIDNRINITNHAASTMKMCAVHREIANIITEYSNKSYSDDDIVTALSNKTKQIISQLKDLGQGGRLSEEKINGSVTNEAAQQWLYRLASAEMLI